MATRRAPGLLRSNFGLKHLVTFDEELWKQERADARKLRLDTPPAPIIVSDIDPMAVDAARKNAVTAGVEQFLEFHTCDFAETPLPETSGTIILHGEYGERLGNLFQLKDTYKRMGDFLKQKCPGWNAWVFTSRELAGSMGLKPVKRVPFENGEFDCRLVQFELYEGSRQNTESGDSEVVLDEA